MTTAEEILNEKGAYMYGVSPDTSIFDALQLMISKRIGAILVKEGDKIVGIWTERDLNPRPPRCHHGAFWEGQTVKSFTSLPG